jgi:hypothetical protein
MKIFTSKVLDYLKDVIPEFTKSKNGALFTCPICKQLKANLIPSTDIVFCHSCHKSHGNIFSLVQLLEPNKYSSLEDIKQYLKVKYKIEYLTEKDVDNIFTFYQSLGFNLVPIGGNSKIPAEKDWTNKDHKSKEEWLSWYEDGLNFGVKGGEKSNLTTVDIDTKEIPEQIKPLLNETLTAITERGFHFIYQYESSIPTTRIDELKLDIINNGKQFVVYPSKVNGVARTELLGKVINKMSPELLAFLKAKTISTPLKTFDERVQEEIKTENIDIIDTNLTLATEGNRHNFLLSLGGILRKEMSLPQVDTALSIINRVCCKPSYPPRELSILVKSLDKYVVHSEQELSVKILNYLKVVGDATGRDVKEVVGETKEKVDKALAYLVREGYIYKKRHSFHVLKRIQWKDQFWNEDKEINFKVPYLNDVAVFRPGDMILIGGQQKVGKSHIALNIIKELIEQKDKVTEIRLKPYYLNLEAGNRFAKIATQLHMVDGDFFNATHFSPESIELEDNAITIIDWLLPKDYSETDKLFQHFAEQLFKHGGLLFVFAQLRTDGNFFAKDMVAMFPALVCRYLYDKDSDGKDLPETGYFSVDYVREPKKKNKSYTIPCKYDFDTRRLIMVNPLNMNNDEIKLNVGTTNVHDREVKDVTGDYPDSFLKEGND